MHTSSRREAVDHAGHRERRYQAFSLHGKIPALRKCTKGRSTSSCLLSSVQRLQFPITLTFPSRSILTLTAHSGVINMINESP